MFVRPTEMSININIQDDCATRKDSTDRLLDRYNQTSKIICINS